MLQPFYFLGTVQGHTSNFKVQKRIIVHFRATNYNGTNQTMDFLSRRPSGIVCANCLFRMARCIVQHFTLDHQFT